MQSNTPIDLFNKNKSWRMQLGGARIKDRNCENCLAGVFDMGGGYSLEFWEKLMAYTMIDLHNAFTPEFDLSSYRIGVGPRVGFLLHFSENLKWLNEAYFHKLFFSRYTNGYAASSQLRLGLDKKWSIQAGWTKYVKETETKFEAFFYF